LWLARTDPTFVVSQETKDFLFENQSILKEEFDTEFERTPFQLGEYSQVTDSFGTDLLYPKEAPATPLYQSDPYKSDSDNGDLSTVKISKSTHSSSNPFSITEEEDHINHHLIRSGVTTLRTKSPNNNTGFPSVVVDYTALNSSSHASDNMSNDQQNDHDYQDNEMEEGETTPIQHGFNGKQLSSTEGESSVFMSTTKKIRLDSASPIDHSLIKKFIFQVKNEDFKSPIEKLIDGVCWRQILRLAKGRNQDVNSITQHARLQQILLLETYVFKEESEVIQLDNNVWNNKTICQLLLECYPESNSTTNDSENFATRAVALLPKFDLSNPSVEQEFVRKVENLQAEVGDVKISPTQHSFVISSWTKMWPKKVQERWKHLTSIV
jgi:hypothetical protein